jgi:hypothetical protein
MSYSPYLPLRYCPHLPSCSLPHLARPSAAVAASRKKRSRTVVVEEEPDRIHRHHRQGPYPDGGEGGGAKKAETGHSMSPRSAVVEACVEHTKNMTLGEEIFNSTSRRRRS